MADYRRYQTTVTPPSHVLTPLHSPIGEYRVEKFPALPVAAPMFLTVTCCCCCDCDWTLARLVKLSRVLREAEMVVVSISVTLRMVVEVTTVVLLLLLLLQWLPSKVPKLLLFRPFPLLLPLLKVSGSIPLLTSF